MKKFFSFTLLTLALVGCDSQITGTTDVLMPLSIKNKKGVATVISPASYESSYAWSAKKHALTLTFKQQGQKKKQKFTIQLPSSVNLPTQNGPISVGATELGQDWNLRGDIHTSNERSRDYRDFEYCSLTRWERICENFPPYRCYDRSVTYPGHRQVEYHYESSHTILNLEFQDAANGAAVGTFDGARSDSDRVYTYYGACY